MNEHRTARRTDLSGELVTASKDVVWSTSEPVMTGEAGRLGPGTARLIQLERTMAKRTRCPYCDQTKGHDDGCPRSEVRTFERSESRRLEDGMEMLDDDYRADYEREERIDPHHHHDTRP